MVIFNCFFSGYYRDVKLLDHLLFLNFCPEILSDCSFSANYLFKSVAHFLLDCFFPYPCVALGGLYILNAVHLSIIFVNDFFQLAICFLILYLLSSNT